MATLPLLDCPNLSTTVNFYSDLVINWTHLHIVKPLPSTSSPIKRSSASWSCCQLHAAKPLVWSLYSPSLAISVLLWVPSTVNGLDFFDLANPDVRPYKRSNSTGPIVSLHRRIFADSHVLLLLVYPDYNSTTCSKLCHLIHLRFLLPFWFDSHSFGGWSHVREFMGFLLFLIFLFGELEVQKEFVLRWDYNKVFDPQ